MTSTQTVTVQTESPQALADLLEDWHRDQRRVAPGYEGARLLSDREQPGRFVVEVDFSSEEEAQRNNARAETHAWAERLARVVRNNPEYRNYEVTYRTT